MKPLKVYKASAGSGKTFRLTVEYIKLLIENPTAYRNILAVTFTNKATEEMKVRILSQLYGLWKQLPDSQGYMNEIATTLEMGEKQVSHRAGMALLSLVHNYNYFRVETIDSFFQSVLRNLARELGLNANLRIGLNDTQVEEQAVDRLIEQLDSGSMVLQWLISYIFSNIDDNKGWNVIGQIKEFGRTIFKDFYKEKSREINDALAAPDFFKSYTDEIYKTREAARKKMEGYADTFDRITAANGLTTKSFKRGTTGIPGYFNKLRGKDFSDKKCNNATLKACLDGIDGWVSKSNKDADAIKAVVEAQLLPLLKQAEQDRGRMWRLCLSADVTLRHLNKLRLLNSIENNVRELNGETNTFLLSDTQGLLQTMIKDTDSPFIFEKIGCQLEHIMIDEFQDTSSVQWKNFKVLLEECMSHATDNSGNTVNNLIVGDVKQSIYRWRDGDWRLLNGITTQFKQAAEKVDVDDARQTNYRSEWNIVEFNNKFFAAAAADEYEEEIKVNTEDTAAEIKLAYNDVEQNKRADKDKDRRGLVNIKLLTDDDYDNNTLTEIENTIDRLIEAGVSQSDIAILIRYKRHITAIADYFTEKRSDINIVSDEAFRLDASLAVNTIIQALTLMLHPDDKLAKATLAITYQKRILGNTKSDSDIINKENVSGDGLDNLLPPDFVQKLDDLIKMPLIDATEFIMSAFRLNSIESESAYICAFFDEIADFMSTSSGNLSTFMTEWTDTISAKTIQSDSTEGVRLITIHKSKGLEFDNVIIPFCDWTLESRYTTLWCQPEESPFNRLPLVPVDYSSKLNDTIYAKDYRNEHIQNTVDNLNLLYVAFTRAGKNLFVTGRKNKGRQPLRSDLLSRCLPQLVEKLEGSTLEGKDNEEAALEFNYGSLAVGQKKNKVSQNVFQQDSTPVTVSVNTAAVPVAFKQSNKSREFTASLDEEDGKAEKQIMYIKTGNILHKIFSTIRTTADIDGALKQLEEDGVIYDDITTAEKVRKMLTDRLTDSRVTEWFSPHWRVFNECNILTVDPETGKVIERRPDRVITNGKEIKVIDFKFGKPKPEYRLQVASYMKLMTDMGYNNVSGFLWYVYTNEIDEIKPEEANV